MDDTSPPARQAAPAQAGVLEAALRSPARLAAVARTGLLDSAPEEAFDALTRMAASLLKVPASFVSILDSDRDFYKSQVGFPDTLAAARQLAGTTFCHHTLDHDAPLVIEDTQASPTWQAVPTVQTLGVRAYVGIPLRLDGQTIGSFCVIDDKPRTWSAEELGILEQLALSAERELGLRVALRDARDEAARSQALVRAKEEIVAVVAHDLRTPLQVLSLSARALQRSCTPQQQAALARMAAATDAMKRMADELLSQHASMPSPGALPGSIGAARLLCDVVDTMALIAARAGIELSVTDAAGAPDAEVSIDYAQMLRVFCNLVGNAIKYSARGSVVSLAATREGSPANLRAAHSGMSHSGGRAGSWIHLRITDHGHGMSPDEQLHAFDHGWQGAEGLARGDGTGLGLPIVKTLVERNGGQVELVSELGQGTTVTVSLPCR